MRRRGNAFRWAALVAVFALVGMLLTNVMQVGAQPAPPGGFGTVGDGPQPHPEHRCTNIDCSMIQTNHGGLCGWCQHPLAQLNFDKCYPDPSYTCTDNGQLFGTAACNGGCTGDPVGACADTYSKCN